ncbi:hypothetical protein B0A50_07384 [Salinomyces thailandicus]|uniref:G-patch domain-containing protein n=1 Tax=Salinomyces thailandicus TaxID=706561 RepID=A0A4U0TMG5_9PEZI|nr:hypothetical protein B0A50_07384 [Salinomyces thailandica]
MADDEDDYLSMTFDDPSSNPSRKETSLQRTRRLKAEAAERSRVPSKKERAENERVAREAALATALDASNKGAQMLAKMGFKGGGLGKSADARTTPVEVLMKEGRGGVGMESERKRKVREAAEAEEGLQKRQKVTEVEYRERARNEREERQAEGGWWSAMRVLEGFETGAEGATITQASEEGEGEGGEIKKSGNEEDRTSKDVVSLDRKPLRAFNLLYRPLIRQRREKEAQQRLRRELEVSLPTAREREDPEIDLDDKTALGTAIEELEDEDAEAEGEADAELEAYEALTFAQRLEKIVQELRTRYRYCFWCKCQYADEEMEGCPGVSEDEHG